MALNLNYFLDLLDFFDFLVFFDFFIFLLLPPFSSDIGGCVG